MKCYAKTCTALLLALTIAGCASTQPSSSTKTVPVSSTGNEAVQSTVDIQGLRDEVASLRNEIEIQRNLLDKLNRRQRELYDDLDYRLRQRERASGGDLSLSRQPPTDGSTLGGSNTGSGFGQPNTAGANATGTPATGSGGLAAGTQGSADGTGSQQQTEIALGAPVQQAVIATPDEQATYDEAFNQLKKSRYAEAVTGFQRLLAAHPSGALADDAQYWIGEAMYVTRDFSGGLGAFQAVVDRFPESPRVAEALLKLGYIQYEIGAKEEARQTLTEVVTRFPGSRVAISAQSRLKKLQ